MMWIVILISVAVAAIAGIAFIMNRALRFGFSKKLYEKNKALGLISSVWPIAICLPFLVFNVFAFIIVIIHLFAIWALTDFIAFIIRKLRKKEDKKRYLCGFVAISITACYLIYGWIMAHTVFITDYTFETDKSLGADDLRIVMLADLHIGATLDGDDFAKQCKRINDAEPDVVLICGDFVDDDSSYEDMVKACDALGTLKAQYGVFWAYGNHDRGYYRNGNFTTEELENRLEQSRVKILCDESVMINENICVIGREDASSRDRLTAAEITKDIDSSKYIIMLDHQPNDYDAIEKTDTDLVLSGHTHGGHVFPAGQIGLLIGANDRVYGTETRQNTVFVVTSGISGWAIPFKTFTLSEFLVIDVKQK